MAIFHYRTKVCSQCFFVIICNYELWGVMPVEELAWFWWAGIKTFPYSFPLENLFGVRHCHFELLTLQNGNSCLLFYPVHYAFVLFRVGNAFCICISFCIIITKLLWKYRLQHVHIKAHAKDISICVVCALKGNSHQTNGSLHTAKPYEPLSLSSPQAGYRSTGTQRVPLSQCHSMFLMWVGKESCRQQWTSGGMLSAC